MRPPKPRITKPRLLWRWKGRWVPIHRIQWTADGKRKAREVTLDWKNDPQELDRLYWACEAGRHEAQQAPQKYTWGELVKAWQADPRVKLSPNTKKAYQVYIGIILEKNEARDVRRTVRKDVRAIHTNMAGTPGKADALLRVISLLWSYAKSIDWPVGDNPVSGITKYGTQNEFMPWPQWLIDALPQSPLNVRTAAEIIMRTGQRPGAAIQQRWDDFVGGKVLVRDEKRDREWYIDTPPDLAAYLEGVPRQGEHILAKNLRNPLTYTAISTAFGRWRNTLGPEAKKYSLHGLRKVKIISMAYEGCTDAEIQAVTGQDKQMVEYYRKHADTFILTKNARERTERKRNETE